MAKYFLIIVVAGLLAVLLFFPDLGFWEKLLVIDLAYKIYILGGLSIPFIFLIGSLFKKTSSKSSDSNLPLAAILVVLIVVYVYGVNQKITFNTEVFSPPRQSDEFVAVPEKNDEFVAIVSEAPSATADNCSLSNKVPENIRQYCGLIDKYAYQYNLDPTLVAAVMQQECPWGDPECYSSSGAAGLMQVMASDGLSNDLYPGMFSDRPKVAELFDPETGIKWGSKILAGYIASYGSVREGLRHYGHQTPNNPYYYTNLVLGHYERFK